MKSMMTVATLLALTSTAYADLAVKFVEGAPKDRFTFRNNSKCSLNSAKLTLDLSGSKSGLIFDVTDKGAGVEVFQPLEFVAGKNALRSKPKVKDGDNKVTLDIVELAPGKSIAFTIDVDDTMGGREITVSGSEIQGATVGLTAKGKSANGTFSSSALASIKFKTCS